MVELIRSSLSGWKSNNLSLGGQLVLLKYVLSYIPVYFLSFFKPSSGIISLLDSIFLYIFFWRGSKDVRKLSWVKWDTKNGGLGVRRLKEFNFSLLGK